MCFFVFAVGHGWYVVDLLDKSGQPPPSDCYIFEKLFCKIWFDNGYKYLVCSIANSVKFLGYCIRTRSVPGFTFARFKIQL